MIALLLLLQDVEIEKLVEQMSDDSIEVRDEAQEKLIRLGKSAVPKLQELEKGAPAEVQSRIQAILKEIDRRERMEGYISPPTLVTLEAEGKLSAILERMTKDARTQVTANGDAAEETVQVSFRGTPLLQAIDELCRAHGGLSYTVNAWDGKTTVQIQKSKYVSNPRAFSDQFVVWLDTVTLTVENDLRGSEVASGSILLRCAWEAGNRPVRARLRLQELADEQGRSHLDLVTNRDIDYGSGYAPTQFDLRLNGVPPSDVKKFSKVKGVLEISFPTDVDELRFEDPASKVGTTLAGRAMDVSLLGFTVSESQVQLKLKTRSNREHSRPEVKLRDKGGKDLSASRISSSIDKGEMVNEYTYRLGKDQEPGVLSVTALIGTIDKSVSFEFKDVAIRP